MCKYKKNTRNIDKNIIYVVIENELQNNKFYQWCHYVVEIPSLFKKNSLLQLN